MNSLQSCCTIGQMNILHKLIVATICIAATLAQPPGGGMQSGDGIWTRDARFGELETFDACFGHQPGSGQYHHHIQPICLRAQLNDNVEPLRSGRTGTIYREKSSGLSHSPILGWALDGYPIYGPYGFSDPKNPSSTIKRMNTSFKLRTIAQRDTLPDWSLSYHSGVAKQLMAAQLGPAINSFFPLGRYIEDYDFVQGLGDLDQYNGRFTITPEYPNGTYAYFLTINADGLAVFPYIMGIQYYGAVTTTSRQVPADALDYFNNGQFTGAQSATDSLLKSFQTKNSQNTAQAVIGWDPSAGAQTTWPGTQPTGARTSGSVTAPINADVQRIRTTTSSVYVNSNDLPSYTIGPWFASMSGGVFVNFPSAQNFLAEVSRTPQAASSARTATGLGSVGVWVNGVSVFNAMDGASYKSSTGDDAGGGIVVQNTVNWSAASLEGGPLAPGSLTTAFSNFGAVLATTTEQATSADWPVSLGGTSVTVKDATGMSTQAAISYASPTQVNYRLPEGMASGLATATFTVGPKSFAGYLNIVPTYPSLFKANSENLAAAQVARIQAGKIVYDAVATPISIGLAAEQATLILYGTGLNSSKEVSVTIGGMKLQPAYAGTQGTYQGLDQINVTLPQSLAGKGKVDIIVTASGKPSNPVNVVFQ